jgi:hypothetical protein
MLPSFSADKESGSSCGYTALHCTSGFVIEIRIN